MQSFAVLISTMPMSVEISTVVGMPPATCVQCMRVPPPAAGDMLLRAADCYDEVVATLQRMEISKEALSTADGRARLVELIHTAGDFRRASHRYDKQGT